MAEALLRVIRRSVDTFDATYGARRMLAEVRAEGFVCDRARVARLMREAALRARPPRRAPLGDTGSRASHLLAANALARDFTAPAPTQKWVADFTYIWPLEGWLYVAVVLDLFLRRVVGGAMPSSEGPPALPSS